MTISVDFSTYPSGPLSDVADWSVTTYAGTLTVASGSVTGTSLSSRANLRSDAWNSNQSSQIVASGTLQSAYPGAIVNGTTDGSGFDGYLFGIDFNSGGTSGSWFIERVTNGSATTLDTGSTGGTITAPVEIRLARESGDIVGYINDVEVGRATDGTYTAGVPGVFLYRESFATTILTWEGTGEAAGAAYSLTCAQGSFSLTGQDVTLTVAEAAASLACDSGSYTLLGSEAYADYQVALVSGSYALNGQTATLRVTAAYTMSAELGTYIYNGFAIPLVYSGAVVTAVPVNSSRRFYGHRLGR